MAEEHLLERGDDTGHPPLQLGVAAQLPQVLAVGAPFFQPDAALLVQTQQQVAVQEDDCPAELLLLDGLLHQLPQSRRASGDGHRQLINPFRRTLAGAFHLLLGLLVSQVGAVPSPQQAHHQPDDQQGQHQQQNVVKTDGKPVTEKLAFPANLAQPIGHAFPRLDNPINKPTPERRPGFRLFRRQHVGAHVLGEFVVPGMGRSQPAASQHVVHFPHRLFGLGRKSLPSRRLCRCCHRPQETARQAEQADC